MRNRATARYRGRAGVGGGNPIFPIDDVGGVSPLFAYGVAKLRSAYTGPAMRVLRPSDSAEQDIGFGPDGKLDRTAIAAFLGTAIGKVLRFYDQSGNGNHTDVQATDAQRVSINIERKQNGHETFYGSDWTYELPASLSTNSRDFSHYAVLANFGGQDAVIQLGAGPAPNTHQFYQPGFGTGYLFASNTLRARVSFSITELHLSATGTISAIAEDSFTGGAQAANTYIGGRIGNTLTSAGYRASGYAMTFIGYGRALAVGERVAIKASLNNLFGMATVAGRVIFIGDSITAGTAGTNGFGYALRSLPLLSKNIPAYNAGGGGSQVQNMIAGYAAGIGTLVKRYADNRVVFMLYGTNDITVGGRTAAQVYADLQTYVGLFRADGAKVIIAPVLPNGVDGKAAIRAELNANLSANWATFADGYADLIADPIMGDVTAPSAYYPDRLHPNDAGHARLAPIAAATINALL